MTREDQLFKALEKGDSSALDELIGLYYPEILRYCLWHAPNRSLAEDAAQETFLKAIRYFDRYNHRGKWRPFLYRVAANTCIDMQRKMRNTDISIEELVTEPAYDDQSMEAAELRQMVRGLPSNLQEIVLLRFGQDMTLREIAQVLDLPMRTVQSRLRSALKQLKKHFTEGGSL
ncbi:MAG: sigma-70 family RNA polymerase sigma factor [Eubacteriales bacterium]|nr:sigma-70 family RNA polymerase sigma factor [Eubacteriales bacterium]